MADSNLPEADRAAFEKRVEEERKAKEKVEREKAELEEKLKKMEMEAKGGKGAKRSKF